MRPLYLRTWFILVLVIILGISLASVLFLSQVNSYLALLRLKGRVVQNNNDGAAGLEQKRPTYITADDPFLGNAKAPVQIVAFIDYACEYSRAVQQTLDELLNLYPGKTKIIFRDFPVYEKHPQAILAAEAAECAQDQNKFPELHRLLFLGQANLSLSALQSYAIEAGLDIEKFNNCMESLTYEQEVINDYNEGIEAGIKGTPTFFIHGRKFQGLVPLDIFKKVVEWEIGE